MKLTAKAGLDHTWLRGDLEREFHLPVEPTDSIVLYMERCERVYYQLKGMIARKLREWPLCPDHQKPMGMNTEMRDNSPDLWAFFACNEDHPERKVLPPGGAAPFVPPPMGGYWIDTASIPPQGKGQFSSVMYNP